MEAADLPVFRLPVIGPKFHHVGVADVFAVAVDHVGRHFGLRVGVGEVEKIFIADLGPIDELAHVLHLLILIGILKSVVAGQIEQGEVIVERGSSGPPVAGPFVAAPVEGVGVEKLIQHIQGFVHHHRPGLIILLQQQHRVDPVGYNPGIPVVWAPAVGVGAHPAVFFLHQRLQDAAVGLIVYPFADLG